jgi:hypothetical protein
LVIGSQDLTQLGRTPGVLGVTTGGATLATSEGELGGLAGVDGVGATHLVQMVEMLVLVTVEVVVMTVWVGLPWGGVTVEVTGQVVKVV